MRLSEVVNPKDAIAKWLKENSNIDSHLQFEWEHGKINVGSYKAAVILKEDLTNIKYPFGDVQCVFDARGTKISSLKNIPSSAFIYNLSAITTIDSLVGIEQIVEKFNLKNSKQRPYYGLQEPTLILGSTKIKKGGLGLVKIPNLKKIVVDSQSDPAMFKAFKIIEKYLGRPEDIFECQTELIDAGLEEYAEL